MFSFSVPLPSICSCIVLLPMFPGAAMPPVLTQTAFLRFPFLHPLLDTIYIYIRIYIYIYFSSPFSDLSNHVFLLKYSRQIWNSWNGILNWSLGGDVTNLPCLVSYPSRNFSQFLNPFCCTRHGGTLECIHGSCLTPACAVTPVQSLQGILDPAIELAKLVYLLEYSRQI